MKLAPSRALCAAGPLVLLALTSPAHAANKCVDAAGNVSYQETTCPSASKTQSISVETGLARGCPTAHPGESATAMVARFNCEKAQRDKADAQTAALRAKPLPPVPVPSAEVQAAARSACIAALRARPWKDRDSLKIEGLTRAGPAWSQGLPVKLVVNYVGMVNGKNSYGAYQGDRPFTCEMVPGNEDLVSLVIVRD